MKRFDVITIFPDFFGVVRFGVVGNAIKDGIIEFKAHDLRDYTEDRHHVTDDTPYGGGAGMVMLAAPIIKAVESIDPHHESLRILLAPRGVVFNQTVAREFAGGKNILVLCGRYEGVDERVAPLFDMEISLGDYILSGGEPAVLVLLDSVARLIPGVLGNELSTEDESFTAGLVEYPHYTKPRVINGQKVPEVLFSGNHAEIRKWRRMMSLDLTRKRRPDLFSRIKLSDEDSKLLERADNADEN